MLFQVVWLLANYQGKNCMLKKMQLVFFNFYSKHYMDQTKWTFKSLIYKKLKNRWLSESGVNIIIFCDQDPCDFLSPKISRTGDRNLMKFTETDRNLAKQIQNFGGNPTDNPIRNSLIFPWMYEYFFVFVFCLLSWQKCLEVKLSGWR